MSRGLLAQSSCCFFCRLHRVHNARSGEEEKLLVCPRSNLSPDIIICFISSNVHEQFLRSKFLVMKAATSFLALLSGIVSAATGFLAVPALTSIMDQTCNNDGFWAEMAGTIGIVFFAPLFGILVAVLHYRNWNRWSRRRRIMQTLGYLAVNIMVFFGLFVVRAVAFQICLQQQDREVVSPNPRPTGDVSESSIDEQFLEHRDVLRNHIRKFWDWDSKEIFRVILLIETNRKGQLEKVSRETSSGNEAFDQSVITAINKASPFPAAPPDVASKFAKIRMDFTNAEE